MTLADRITPTAAALLALIGTAGTLIGAWVFEYGFGLEPCPLCLEQRWPYYVGIPVAAVAALAFRFGRARAGALLLGAFVVAMLYSTGLGAYHSGVEWEWWEGPSACAAAGGGPGFSTEVGDLRASLAQGTVPSCTEAAWRFLGLSLAGYNVLISLALAALAVLGIRAAVSGTSRTSVPGGRTARA